MSEPYDDSFEVEAKLQRVLELESQLAAAKAEIVRLSGKTGFCLECERLAKDLEKMRASREEWCDIAFSRKDEIKRLREALENLIILTNPNGPITDRAVYDYCQAVLDGEKANIQSLYPCQVCGLKPTKYECGTIFTVCDDCYSAGKA